MDVLLTGVSVDSAPSRVDMAEPAARLATPIPLVHRRDRSFSAPVSIVGIDLSWASDSEDGVEYAINDAQLPAIWKQASCFRVLRTLPGHRRHSKSIRAMICHALSQG